jgi:hypothetical protein
MNNDHLRFENGRAVSANAARERRRIERDMSEVESDLIFLQMAIEQHLAAKSKRDHEQRQRELHRLLHRIKHHGR